MNASGTVSGAVLASGAALAPGRPLLLATLPSGATSTNDATAEPGLRYTYCVTAYANAGAETTRRATTAAAPAPSRRSSSSPPTASSRT